jgi:hypothetical protein
MADSMVNFDDLYYPTPATTNEKDESRVDLPGPPMPARVFFFWVIDEIGKDGYVRMIYADEATAREWIKEVFAGQTDKGLEKLLRFELQPEKYGLRARRPASTKNSKVAKHVMAKLPAYQSPYLSASSQFPEGSPRFSGRRIFIDKQRLRASGAKVVTTEEIVDLLEAYGKKHPHEKSKVEDFINKVRNIDKEVLIQPNDIIPPGAIITHEQYAMQKKIRTGGYVLGAFSFAFTAYDINVAAGQSIEIKSVKPLAAESIRQVGGWGGAYIGAELGAAVGVWYGGVGAPIGALIGGIVGGWIGYGSADGVADSIHAN